MGLQSSHGVPCAGRVRTGWGWGWILRSSCQYDRRILVFTAVMAPPAPRDLAGETAAVSGVLQVRPQRPPTRQGVARGLDRSAGHANPPKRRMSENLQHPQNLGILTSPTKVPSGNLG